MGKRLSVLAIAVALASAALWPGLAFADDEPSLEDGGALAAQTDSGEVSKGEAASLDAQGGSSSGGTAARIDDVVVSDEGEAALIEGATFAVDSFSRAQKGSNRELDGRYLGYSYYQGSSADYAVAVATETYVLVYIPPAAHALCDVEDPASKDALKHYFLALDEVSLTGGIVMDDAVPWHFTSEPTATVEGVVYSFAVEVGEGKYYVTAMGEDGSDVVSSAVEGLARPTHVDFLKIVAPDAVDIAPPVTGIDSLARFLNGIDLSPLWVTLKTTGTAIVLIFVLGLAAAYFTLRISKRAQDIFDTIFTIPMVLPPTVCGFLLLLALGRNTALGQWFIDIGFPLIFSWQATVIAAVVVAFPLMYRSARGAFEGLDPNMLDAARTLGWSNAKIFFKLMLPLSWSSIAAGTVLAFARALGEFGATLFLAGNYVGITRTIPIAIYFEWMSGNMDVALFWTVVILIFSFVVILFINLWSRRTTRYRKETVE
ncbi:molybdate ABC transporter permease subunit [Raoultibacter phocaeensis]|uniref:molybdate ABC transporter permease subunit n=1 Tax=Raoultibacter phocaeensis TaxID=2479841 RepID=UPI0011185EF4|nr:molybdate ABC transporter permease subunit [Raoultibacter phocaeensis]